ncbi:hypothetical protein, partial [uncultured Alistipes sp.]|uniref:hypothetical protein n=1 Tax=uncultured Alistipes sp. TaxID=538949 RepID=UPI0025D4364C
VAYTMKGSKEKDLPMIGRLTDARIQCPASAPQALSASVTPNCLAISAATASVVPIVLPKKIPVIISSFLVYGKETAFPPDRQYRILGVLARPDSIMMGCRTNAIHYYW